MTDLALKEVLVSGIGIKNQNADLLQLFYQKKPLACLCQVYIFFRV